MNKVFKNAVCLTLTVGMFSLNVFALGKGNNKISTLKQYSSYHDAVEDITGNDDFSDYNANIQMEIGDNKITSDNGTVTLDVASYEENDRTMIPMRGIGEILNVDVDWDTRTETAVYHDKKENRKVYVKEDESFITVEQDGEKKEIAIDTASVTRNDRMYVPVRAIAEALNISVGYDAATNTVSFSNIYYTKRISVKCGGNTDEVVRYINGLEGKMQMVQSGDDELLVQFDCMENAKRACEKINDKFRSAEALPDVVVSLKVPESGGSAKNALDANGEDNMVDTRLSLYADSLIAQNNSKQVKIAVVDTGVNKNHKLFNGVDVQKGDDNALNDKNGHGTHVAGIMAQALKSLKYTIMSYNGIFAGSEHISASKLKSKFENISETSDADVINLSMQVYCDEEYAEPIKEAVKNMANNAILVISAGNINNSDGIFAQSVLTMVSHNNIIIVGNSDGNKYHKSAIYGNYVDLSAPGVNIYSANAKNSSNYVCMTGTSQSAPHVTAAAAMLLMDGVNKSSVKSTLKGQCVRVPSGWKTSFYGAGILDMTSRLGDDIELPEIRDDEETVQETPQPVETPLPGETPQPIEPQPVNPAEKTITGYEWAGSAVSGNKVNVKAGESTSVTLYEKYSDGTKSDITDQVKYASNKPNVARVDSNGTITAAASGTAIITVSFTVPSESMNAAPSALTVKVTADETPVNPIENVVNNLTTEKTITGYEWAGSAVSGNTINLDAGDSTNVTLYEKYSDGTKSNITGQGQVKFVSNKTNIAKVDSNGKITAVASGTARITVNFSDPSATQNASPSVLTVKVTAPTPTPTPYVDEVSITGYEWSQTSITLDEGDSTNVTLYEKYSDGTKKDVTKQVTYNISDSSVVQVSNGKIKGIKGGSATITASFSVVSVGVPAPRPLKVTVEAVIEENTDYEVEDTSGGVEITKYVGSDTRVEIPDTINGKKVVSIGEKAFSKTSIKSVSMPSSVKYIGKMAFYNCKSLKTVNFSSKISEMGEYAFDSCTSLTGVTLPASLGEIPNYAFRSCKALKRITLNRGISEVGDNAFAFCGTLKVTVLNDNIDISAKAFTKGESIAIYANSPSSAEDYAKKYGFSFYVQ